MKLPSALSAFAVLIYAAAMTAYVYGFEHRRDYAREIGAHEVVIYASFCSMSHSASSLDGGRSSLSSCRS